MADTPSFTDLASIMKAGQAEADFLQEETSQMIGSECNEEGCTECVTEVKSTHLEKNLTPVNRTQDIKDALNHTNISAMLNQISGDPEKIGKLMNDSMGQVTPDMMEQARKLATGGQGAQIFSEMQRRGMDPMTMKKQLMKHKRSMMGLDSKGTGTQQCILITVTRQVKTLNIAYTSIQSAACGIFKSSSPLELSCSRMAQGPLSGKNIKMWYNPEHKGKNRRASKIAGLPIGGELLLVMESGDFTEADFTAAEKLLE